MSAIRSCARDLHASFFVGASLDRFALNDRARLFTIAVTSSLDSANLALCSRKYVVHLAASIARYSTNCPYAWST